MKTAEKVWAWIAGILLGISTLFQLFALLGGVIFNSHNDFATRYPWLIPTWVGALAMLIVGFVCLVCTRRTGGAILAVALSAAGAVLALLVALRLQGWLMVEVSVTGAYQGLTSWRLWYRHLSSVVAGGLTAALAAEQIFVRHLARLDAEEQLTRTPGSTLGFEPEETEPEPTKKLKRSQKSASRKKSSEDGTAL